MLSSTIPCFPSFPHFRILTCYPNLPYFLVNSCFPCPPFFSTLFYILIVSLFFFCIFPCFPYSPYFLSYSPVSSHILTVLLSSRIFPCFPYSFFPYFPVFSHIFINSWFFPTLRYSAQEGILVSSIFRRFSASWPGIFRFQNSISLGCASTQDRYELAPFARRLLSRRSLHGRRRVFLSAFEKDVMAGVGRGVLSICTCLLPRFVHQWRSRDTGGARWSS